MPKPSNRNYYNLPMTQDPLELAYADALEAEIEKLQRLLDLKRAELEKRINGLDAEIDRTKQLIKSNKQELETVLYGQSLEIDFPG